MYRAPFVLIVAAISLLGGCSDDRATTMLAESECRSLEINGKSYRMRVPAGSSIEQDAVRGSILIRPSPNGRMVRFLSLAPQAGLTLPPPETSATLANGLSISYSIDDEIGGGSGGAEEEMSGEMLLDSRTPIVIACHDQGELSRDAGWCLEYLGTLAPEACT